jgi:hypothetical protein
MLYLMLRLLVILLILFSICKDVKAQYGNRIYITDRGISAADSQQLFFRFRNATFINNKEFFNPYQPGYTLIGYFIRPLIEYNAGPGTRITAGAHLLKYSGVGKFTRYVPVFTFHHRFSSGVEMVFGSLYGALDHGLIEPLFSFERVFTRHNESGLQLLVDKERFKADAWIDWERFIFTGDPFQEEFTAGFSSTLLVSGIGSPLRVEIPIQFLATHKGGQIDLSDERLQTLVNMAGGVHVDLITGQDFFSLISFRGYLALFRDLSNEFQYPYDNGWGIYPNLYVRTRLFDWGIGYWRGTRFVAPRGEPLFQSVSQVDHELATDHRMLYTSKLIYNRKLLAGINMGLRFEVYYDPFLSNFDHTGGLHIMIDERFFITRLRGN